MEKRYDVPFRVTLLTNCLVLLLSFAGVMSIPIVTDVMNNDSMCEASKFLHDSPYVQECTTVSYPVNLSFNLQLGTFLCLGLYDTAFKICQYSSQHIPPFPNVSMTFDSQVKQQLKAANNSELKKTKFCNNLQGYTPLNKTEHLQELSKNINTPNICTKICFDLSDKLQPSCAVLSWIKNIDDNIKNLAETRHNSAAPMNAEMMSDEKPASTEGIKKISEKETKDQASKLTVTPSKANEGDDIKANNPNPPGDTSITVAKADTEGVKLEKLNENENETSKKLEETPDHKTILTSVAAKGNREDVVNPGASIVQVAKPAKNPPANSNPPQTAPAKELAGNAPKDVTNPENMQELDAFKASTISQNTQDDVNDTNLEEEMESNRGDNMDDIDDIPQQVDINKEPSSKESQNILQEASEQKDNNLQYSSASIEEESHFFTYFTVITVACIAGYIGYHNKQKILAIVLEGRRSRSRGRRRPSTANYRKLDCTLEEAVTSQCNANVTHVIY